MGQKRTLILKSEQDSFEKFYSSKMGRKNVDICSVYRFNSGIFRKLMIIWIQILHFPVKEIWYGSWKKRVKEYDKIIVFDRILGYDVLKYIHKMHPCARLIFWYWNTVEKLIPDSYREYCECWSFDLNDCRNYGFKKNNQFYFRTDLHKCQCSSDVFFAGKDKGRYEQLRELYCDFIKAGLKVDFTIVTNKYNDEFCVKELLSYETILDKIENTKCIVEIIKSGQSGLSVRVLEALFYNKKLITNNQLIIKEAFYHPDNIFILGKDRKESLKYFIEKPYHFIEDSVKNQYVYDAWLRNFN